MGTPDNHEPSGQWSAAFDGASLDGMQAYEESLVEALFTPWAEFLLDQLGPSPGDAFLDVATGPGTVARLAAIRVGPTGAVVATDISQAMLTLARGKPSMPRAASIDYRHSPAAPLDVPDSAFDAASCQQGLQFFPDRTAALAELRRALRPGGRLGLTVWSAIERCPVFDALASAIGAVLGDDLAARYRGGPWGLSDPQALGAMVSAAGFKEVSVEEVTRPARFVKGAAQMERSLAASAVATEISALPDADRVAFSQAIASRLEPLTDRDGSVCSDLTSQVALAVA